MVDLAAASGERAVSFGPFRLLPARRLLLEGDKPVRLGSRALDMLIALIEHPGEVVGRDELMARVWPNTHVDEGNLKFQMSALRRTLGGGNRYLVNVPGRGYCFIAPVTRTEQPKSTAPQATATEAGNNLPAHLTRLIGRADTVSRLARQLTAQRLLTIVGTGGIGKTSVALAVAEVLIPTYEHGAWLIDLAPLADPRLVPTALADALGFEIHSEDPLPHLLEVLRDRRTLLVLDNCEHIIDAAAALAVAVLRSAREVQILATSREPLRIEGEHVHRLASLASPPASARLAAAEALRFPAVQLFVERATESSGEFELSDANASLVGDICNKLDGIALAIELAAARVDVFGARGVAAHLDDRFRLLTKGRRTALPRHRTLRATLDWSYDLLPEPEHVVLRRLAIFTGGFTEEAASAVAASTEIVASEIVESVANLVAKSLVSVDVGDAMVRYRLSETIRAYALQKLAESGEHERIARRHAEYHLDLFEQAEAEVETAEWLAQYRPRIDNLRAALDWAFSLGGDVLIGVALTAAAVPLWMRLSLMEECQGRVERALAALGSGASRDARHEMMLHAALGASLLYTRGAAVPETGAAWTRSLEIAESLDDAEYRLRALWGLWHCHTASGRLNVALALAQRFCSLAASRFDPNDQLIGERLLGVSQHYLGDQPSARRHIERVLDGYVTPDRRSHIIRFQSDQRVMARAFLAWILWLQGFPEQAMRAAQSNIEEARATNHAVSLCSALAWAACPIALLVGDLAVAEHYVGILLDHLTRHALAHWGAYGRCHQGALVIKRGDVVTGLRLLRAGMDELGEARSPVLRLIALLMAEALGRAGQIADGLAAVEEVLAWTEQTEERWLMAELLRIKGELLLLHDAPAAAAAAGDHFRQALDWACRQGALSWELRAATSLARLLRDQGRSIEAAALLQPVYDRFTEGFDTADLRTAKRLLDELTDVARG